MLLLCIQYTNTRLFKLVYKFKIIQIGIQIQGYSSLYTNSRLFKFVYKFKIIQTCTQKEDYTNLY